MCFMLARKPGNLRGNKHQQPDHPVEVHPQQSLVIGSAHHQGPYATGGPGRQQRREVF